MFKLEVEKRGNRILGYDTDVILSQAPDETWYNGDDGKASEIVPDFDFADMEVAGDIRQSKENELLNIEGYRGNGFYIKVDHSDKVGDIGISVTVQPEGARFKVKYSPRKKE